MIVKDLKQVTPWSRALDAALVTVGKTPTGKEPSYQCRAKMLMAEHSPIRLVEYQWIWEGVPQWVTAHLTRHHIGCEKFVCSQREDRSKSGRKRSELSQAEPNTMLMTANAQALINISRKRLCAKASPETREAWKAVIGALSQVDPRHGVKDAAGVRL